MSGTDIYVALIITATLPTCILYVLFGQLTVRRLRKKPETKDALGMEFASGWDILNAAQALSIPRSWNKKLENSPLSALHGNSEILYKNTSRFDRFLARLFFCFFVSVGSATIILVILYSVGVLA